MEIRNIIKHPSILRNRALTGLLLKIQHTREEHKHLVGWIVVVGDQDGEVGSSWSTLAGFVSKLASELIKSLIQLILRHQITTIVAKLHGTDKDDNNIEYFCYLNVYCILRDPKSLNSCVTTNCLRSMAEVVL